jgi:hypothetical protein
MVVVDHQPHDWFLLRDERGFVLDVNCGQSAVGFSVVVRLAGTETGLIETRGREAVTELARSIQNNPAAFADRSGGASLEQAAYAAIVRWQARQPAD